VHVGHVSGDGGEFLLVGGEDVDVGVGRQPGVAENLARLTGLAVERRAEGIMLADAGSLSEAVYPSQVDLLSWPREGSAHIFGRRRPSCPVAGRCA
jgi:hypothetical protein